jgi:hypothetical protein
MEMKYRKLYYLEKNFNMETKFKEKNIVHQNLLRQHDITKKSKQTISDASDNLIRCRRNLADPSMRFIFMFYKLHDDTEIVRTNPSTARDIKAGIITPLLDFLSRGITYNPNLTQAEQSYYLAEFIFRAYVQASNNGVKPSDMVARSKRLPQINIDVTDMTILPGTFANTLKAAEMSPKSLGLIPIDKYNIELSYYLTADGGDEFTITVQKPSVSNQLLVDFTTFIVVNCIIPYSEYSTSDNFNDYDGKYMNINGKVLVNSPLISYDTSLQRIIIKSSVESDIVINEILVFNRILSPLEIDTIVSYLSYKWVCIKYMPITSRFFPDNYKSNSNTIISDMRTSFYASIYNILDPLIESLNMNSYNKSTKTGNPLLYFNENININSEYMVEYKNYVDEIRNSAYAAINSNILMYRNKCHRQCSR